MKRLTKNIIAMLLVIVFAIGCAEKSPLPEGFEVVWNKANIYFVYLHENLRGEKSAQRRACLQLCGDEPGTECEVYMWSDRDRIPEGLPIRNAGSFVHSVYKFKDGKKKYKCLECVSKTRQNQR